MVIVHKDKINLKYLNVKTIPTNEMTKIKQ